MFCLKRICILHFAFSKLLDLHSVYKFPFFFDIFEVFWKLYKKEPGLTSQRHSALISSDSEYFQVCFSALHYLKISEQPWFSSEQRWKRKFSELKISAETALIFSETELNSADLLKQLWNCKRWTWNLSFISYPHRTFAIFIQGNLDITFSGNLDLILVPQIFPEKPQISRSLEI